MKPWVLIGTFLLAVAGATAACGGADQPGSSSIGQARPDAGAAPDFGLVAYQGVDVLGGEAVRFSEVLAQGRPVVLNFWAGLCPPCRMEMPHLDEVARDYEGRVRVIGLDVGPFTGLGSREDGRVLLEELGVAFPAGTTYDAEVVQSYEVMGMPTTFFITPEGDIHRKWTGLNSKDKLTELVKELVTISGQRT
jgi:thiol-disulfide isomerase/thioredoxin